MQEIIERLLNQENLSETEVATIIGEQEFGDPWSGLE